MPLVLAVCVSPILNCMIFSGANRVSDLFLRKILQSGSVGLRSESRAAPPHPPNSLLTCSSRRSRASLCLLLPTANHPQQHRAALVDFHRFAVGGQRDFTNRLRPPGSQDFKVAESV